MAYGLALGGRPKLCIKCGYHSLNKQPSLLCLHVHHRLNLPISHYKDPISHSFNILSQFPPKSATKMHYLKTT
ncbi:hypothetical protein BDA99DRAFT_591441 [Phascolomyces articulosus]|uniref:Uncharacterized protein n=1 Tax=Phascolomyces articulosus TaxID=60185 RepID=A0AAD5KSF1_9FUNG|nr:hypothetical protein BDA99DRAFT_591441 [Phascolomyces articulosus]